MIDVGLSFGPSAKAEGLLQPYKVATWDTIPDSAKDADGFWYGDYYGVLAFEVNTDIVKKLPAGLGRSGEEDYAERGGARRRSPRLEPGDPSRLRRRAGGRRGCWRAAGEAGLKFFAELNQGRQLRAGDRQGASLAQGSTPIMIRWDYNALSDRDTLKGNPPVEVVSRRAAWSPASTSRRSAPLPRIPTPPSSGWNISIPTRGRLGWLAGYCHPIRFNDWSKNGKVPQAMLDKLPPAAAYEAAVFPTLADQGAAKEAITSSGTPSSARTSSRHRPSEAAPSPPT